MSSARQPVVAIVDDYSTAENYPDEFFKQLAKLSKLRDVKLVHVQSQRVPKVFQETHARLMRANYLGEPYFIENIISRTKAEKDHITLPETRDNEAKRRRIKEDQLERVEDALEQLKKYDVLFAVPGTECGVKMADHLSARLGLATSNGIEKTEARRNKHEMHLALKAAGIAYAEGCLSDDINKIFDFVRPYFAQGKPVILKPVSDAATNNVKKCKNEEDVRAAFALIMSSEDTFGDPNTDVLAQEFLDGPEYIVNTVSRDGVLFVTDICHEVKQEVDGSMTYDCEKRIQRGTPLFIECEDYVKCVAGPKALAIQNGPGHAEMIKTKKGLVLVEMAARMGGGIDLTMCTKADGFNIVEKSVQSYVDPEAFKKFATSPPAKNSEHITWNVFSRVEAPLDKCAVNHEFYSAEEFRKVFPTFAALHSYIKVGEPLDKTINLLTSPFYAYFHGLPEAVEKDYRRFRQYEQAILVEVCKPANEKRRSLEEVIAAQFSLQTSSALFGSAFAQMKSAFVDRGVVRDATFVV